MKRVLCILEDGFEEIEAIAPVNLLRRAGVEVVMAGGSGKCSAADRESRSRQTHFWLSSIQKHLTHYFCQVALQ